MNALTWIPLAAAALFPAQTANDTTGGFDSAIDRARGSVVRLYGLGAGLSAGYGSGILVSDDGLVVTVMSLLLDSERLRVVAADGTSYGADIVNVDTDQHLALLRLKSLPHYNRRGRLVEKKSIGPGSFDSLTSGDSTKLEPGDWVLAAGNPFKVAQGNEPVSVSVGTFSTRTHLDARRKTRDFSYQGEVLIIDVVTSTPGTPGGALLNLDGQWVGMIGRLVISNRTHTNLNYALPVETVTAFIAASLNPNAADHDTPHTDVATYHGIKLFELGYQKRLVYVDRVKRNSPAKRAGLRKDDLIVSIAARSVPDLDGFNRIMAGLKPGDEIEFVVIRNEQLKNLTLILEEAPQ